MELISADNERCAILIEYLGLLSKGPISKDIFARYSSVLSSATAFEVNEALDSVLASTNDMEAWKIPVARFIRSVSVGLDAQAIPEYPKGGVFSRLDNENSEIVSSMAALQELIKRVRKGESTRVDLAGWLGNLSLLRRHYIALQNELFPLFERTSIRHSCVKMMWALQDETLGYQRSLVDGKGGGDEKVFWETLGSFYMTAGMLAYREKTILLPVAFKATPDYVAEDKNFADSREDNPIFTCPTGSLTGEELELMFKSLPVNVSFIGSDDRVKFYSDPPHRIFPRNPAVIGRLVQNCHPPKSVAVVEDILRSFKSGERDTAEFWLTSRGAFVHIQYFALRNAEGRYLGTLEVSQDASHLRSLEGEKRLL
jgi:hypothetical protein